MFDIPSTKCLSTYQVKKHFFGLIFPGRRCKLLAHFNFRLIPHCFCFILPSFVHFCNAYCRALVEIFAVISDGIYSVCILCVWWMAVHCIFILCFFSFFFSHSSQLGLVMRKHVWRLLYTFSSLFSSPIISFARWPFSPFGHPFHFYSQCSQCFFQSTFGMPSHLDHVFPSISLCLHSYSVILYFYVQPSD